MPVLEWIEDESLTETQRKIKWYLYTEIDMTFDLEDLKHALDSLIENIEYQIQSSIRRR